MNTAAKDILHTLTRCGAAMVSEHQKRRMAAAWELANYGIVVLEPKGDGLYIIRFWKA